MLFLSWIFLWIASGEKIKGLNLSDCTKKNIIWTHSARREEEFPLFCDLSSYNHCKKLSDVQPHQQPQAGEPLGKIISSYPHIIKKNTTLHVKTIGINDSGSFICSPSTRIPQSEACCVNTVLEVEPKTNTSCVNPTPHIQELLLGSVGCIYCPCLSHHRDAQSPEVTWYQNGELLSKERSNSIIISSVYVEHEGTYICDYTQSDNSSSWIVRTFIQVRTFDTDTDFSPIILDTTSGTLEVELDTDTDFSPTILDTTSGTLEVELGKPLSLYCTAQFGFEKNSNPVLRWYKDSDQGWKVLKSQEECVESTKDVEKIKLIVSLEKVTQNDLYRNFTCFAQNSIGTATRSIFLRPKKGVVNIYILLSTVLTLAAVLTVCALLYTYWIEIVLLYRTYQNKDETLGDKKEFDAFISYAKWNSWESEATSSLSEENLALNLFPEVLENKYGYTLCLLDRDVAPGGVYAEDIVNIIKKSRRGVFILSPNYMNGPGLFELQAAVNLALGDQMLKLILIKFSSFQEPEALPHLVKKALKVLPTVTWRGLKSIPPNSRFWNQMRYHMPVKSAARVTGNQLKIIP